MGPKQKPKIELILLKNYKKTKSNLLVKPNITYQELLKKISYFTTKQFTLEVLSADGSSSQPLYEESLPTFLANYKGQLINIVTTSSTISNAPSKPEGSTTLQDQIINMKVQESPIILDPLKQEEIIKRVEGPIAQKLKQLANENITRRRHQIEEVEYDKKCSQCQISLKGVYYLCLKCPNQFILCAGCEQKQTYSQLTHHKYRAHPFTKVKPFKHQIKTVKIETIQPDDISINLQQEPIAKETPIIRKPDSGEDHLEVHDLIRMKLDWVIRSYMIHL